MRVSVVTPNYNGASTIAKTMWSIANQKYREVEHIVVDDGSTDDSRRIVKSSGLPVVLVCKQNGGLASAVNAGFQRASGEIVCWLDSDNLLLPGAIQGAVEAFRRSPNASMVYGDYCLIDEVDRVFGVRRQPKFDYDICLHGYQTVSNAAVFLDRQLLLRAAGADENLKCACDMDLFVRMAQIGDVIHLPLVAGAYRVRRDAMHNVQRVETEKETWLTRMKFAKGITNPAALQMLHMWHKHRAAMRIVAEGGLWCRVWPTKAQFVKRAQEAVDAALCKSGYACIAERD